MLRSSARLALAFSEKGMRGVAGAAAYLPPPSRSDVANIMNGASRPRDANTSRTGIPISAGPLPGTHGNNRVPADDAALAGPDDRCRAPVHAKLLIERPHMVADGVAGQTEKLAHLMIAQSLADQAQDFALAGGEVMQVGSGRTWTGRLSQCRQFFHDAAAEPGRVCHDGFNRLDQFILRALSFGNVLHHAEHTTFVVDGDGIGGYETIEQEVIFCTQLRIQIAYAAGGGNLLLELPLSCGIRPQTKRRGIFAEHFIFAITRDGFEGLIYLHQLESVAFEDCHRNGRQSEGFGKALLALTQRGFGLLARIEIGEGEEYALFIAKLDRFSSEDHELEASLRKRDAPFHLRNGPTFLQSFERELAFLGLMQNINFLQASPDQPIPSVTGHLQKARIGSDVATIGHATDDGRRRVGVEGTFEACFGLKSLGFVLDNEHEVVGRTGIGRYDQAADRVKPALLRFSASRDLNGEIAEAFPRGYAVDRITAGCHGAIAAIAKSKATSVFAAAASEILDRAYAVHGERGIVRPYDPAVDSDQDDALGQARNDLLQLPIVAARSFQRFFRHVGRTPQEAPRLTLSRRAVEEGWRRPPAWSSSGSSPRRFASPEHALHTTTGKRREFRQPQRMRGQGPASAGRQAEPHAVSIPRLLLGLLSHEDGLDVVQEFDLRPVLAHDDALLDDRERVVPRPVDDESGGEACQHEGEDERHPVEHHRLCGIGRGGVELHLQPHGHAHDQRPDAEMQEMTDHGDDRRIEWNEAEQREDIGWVGGGEIPYPAEKRCVTHLNGHEKHLVEREEHGNLNDDRQTTRQWIDLFLLVELH